MNKKCVANFFTPLLPGEVSLLTYHVHCPQFHLQAEAAALLVCFAKGSCIAQREDVAQFPRGSWKLDKFQWFKPATKTKSLQIHLLGDIARQLVISVWASVLFDEAPWFSNAIGSMIFWFPWEYLNTLKVFNTHFCFQAVCWNEWEALVFVNRRA